MNQILKFLLCPLVALLTNTVYADGTFNTLKNCTGVNLRGYKLLENDYDRSQRDFNNTQYHLTVEAISSREEYACLVIDRNRKVIIDIFPTMVEGLCGGQWDHQSKTPIWLADVGGGRAGIDKIYYSNAEESLRSAKKTDVDFIHQTVEKLQCTYMPYTQSDLEYINNIAFYLNQLGYYGFAIELLHGVIQVNPNRSVAYLNLADAYHSLGQNQAAKQNYSIYYQQMKNKGLLKKVPLRVLKNQMHDH